MTDFASSIAIWEIYGQKIYLHSAQAQGFWAVESREQPWLPISLSRTTGCPGRAAPGVLPSPPGPRRRALGDQAACVPSSPHLPASVPARRKVLCFYNCIPRSCTEVSSKIYSRFKWPRANVCTRVLPWWQPSTRLLLEERERARSRCPRAGTYTPQVTALLRGAEAAPPHSGASHAQPGIRALVAINRRWDKLRAALNLLSGMKGSGERRKEKEKSNLVLPAKWKLV